MFWVTCKTDATDKLTWTLFTCQLVWQLCAKNWIETPYYTAMFFLTEPRKSLEWHSFQTAMKTDYIDYGMFLKYLNWKYKKKWVFKQLQTILHILHYVILYYLKSGVSKRFLSIFISSLLCSLSLHLLDQNTVKTGIL